MAGLYQAGPQPAVGGGVLLAASPEQLQTALDHSIWYLLSLWPALHVACANDWGGPASGDKKDWFAGAVSDLLTARPDTDAEDLEIFLLQVMQDEFDCNVEDETEVDVARDILVVKKRLLEERTIAAAQEVEQRWRSRGQLKSSVQVQNVDQDVDDDDDEWEGLPDDDDDMEEAPALVPAVPKREKAQPQVDDDGFTKVPYKKKR